MKLAIILNTGSGRLSNPEEREALLAALRDAGLDAAVLPVTTEGEIAEAIRPHLENGCGTVIAAGGDGTVSAVAAMLLGTDASLGVIPGGTLNHFAKDLKIPLDFVEAVRVIKAGVKKRVDVAAVNGRPFLNNSGLGLYPEMVLKREEIRRKGFRKVTALLVAAALTLLRFPLLRLHLETTGKAIDRLTPFVFVGNNPYEFDGTHFGTRPRLDTGLLCIWLARGTGRFVLLRAIFQMAVAGLRGVRNLDVLYTRETSIKSHATVVPVSIDGEVVHLQTPLRYEIRPRALSVIVPAGESG